MLCKEPRVVRATTTGIAAIIDLDDRIQRMTPTSQAATLEAEIAPVIIATTYKRFGNLFAYACLAIASGGVLLARVTPASARV